MSSVAHPRRGARRLALPVVALAVAASVAWAQAQAPAAHATQADDTFTVTDAAGLQTALDTISQDLTGGKVDDYVVTVNTSALLPITSTLELSPSAVPAGATVTIAAGSGMHPTIDGGDVTTLLDLDGAQAGGLDVTISGVGFQNGSDAGAQGGGAAIIAGSANGGPADTLTVRNSSFAGNLTSGPDSPGGAIQFVGGALTVTGSTFQNDSTGDATSDGGDIYYAAAGTSGQSLTVSDSTFTQSHSAGNGGAIAAAGAFGAQSAAMSLTGNTFTATTATGHGGAVHLESGTLTAQANVFSQTASDYYVEGAAQLSSAYDFFLGAGQRAVDAPDATGHIVAQRDWWGCQTGPNTAGCASATATATTAPYLTLAALSTPGPVLPHGSTVLTVGFQTSTGGAITPSSMPAIVDEFSSWSFTTTGGGVVAPTGIGNGQISAVYSASTAAGTVTFRFLGASGPQFTIPLATPPSFVATPSSIAAVVGNPYDTSLSYAGTDAAVSEVSGPAWLALTDLGNGAATLSGTPATTDAGDGSLVLRVSSTWGSTDVTIPVSVAAASVFTQQPQSTTVTPGTHVVLSAAATGTPAPTLQWQSSSDGGASWQPITGATSPTLDLGEVPVTLDGTEYRVVASNAAGSVDSEVATLLVGDAPAIAASDPLLVAMDGSSPTTFEVSGPGNIVVAISGSQPVVLLSHPGGSTWELLPIAPGIPFSTQITITATSEYGTTSKTVTAIGGAAPAVTAPPASTTALVGDAVSFTAAASGSPAPSVQWQVSTDGGASFTDIPGATSTELDLTATAAENGTQYRAVFGNPFAQGVTTDAATLTVHTPAAFAPGTPTTASFTRGVAGGSTTVTASGDGPLTLSLAGALPAGIRFTDNGDGTATISGTTTDAPGSFPVTITAHNGFGADATLPFVVTVAAVVPPALPDPLPLDTDGALGGVPNFLHPLDTLTITGSGFAPFSAVALGAYSTPISLGTVTADASGAFSTSVTLPAALVVGQVHTLAAVGLGSSGGVRTLASSFTLLAAVVAADPGSGAGAGSGSADAAGSGSAGTLPAALAATGAADHAGELLLLAALLLLAGAAVLLRRRLSRRS